MKTLFIGQNCIDLKSVDSTNTYASELLCQTRPPEGTLIYTFDQQNGRGQRGNTWESEPNKNVALSFILYPAFLQTDKQFLLNKITSLAVSDLMADLLNIPDKSKEIKIKWPNDIYVRNKKIAGILIENTLSQNTIKNTIVGIGVNVNQIAFEANRQATSLALITSTTYNLMNCMEHLCEFVEARYLQLKTNKLENINNDYLQRLYQFNEWSNYIADNQLFEGKIIGISVFGKLQVQLKSNEVKSFDLKEIKFCIPDI